MLSSKLQAQGTSFNLFLFLLKIKELNAQYYVAFITELLTQSCSPNSLVV